MPWLGWWSSHLEIISELPSSPKEPVSEPIRSSILHLDGHTKLWELHLCSLIFVDILIKCIWIVGYIAVGFIKPIQLIVSGCSRKKKTFRTTKLIVFRDNKVDLGNKKDAWWEFGSLKHLRLKWCPLCHFDCSCDHINVCLCCNCPEMLSNRFILQSWSVHWFCSSTSCCL